MLNRIRDFLYSLRSEKYKRKVMEEAFAAVGNDEPPSVKPPATNWRIRVGEALLIGVLGSLIAATLWHFYGL